MSVPVILAVRMEASARAAARARPEDGASPAATVIIDDQASTSGRLEVGKLLALAAQVGLAVFVIYQFHIGGPAFSRLSVLTAVGFAIHSLLPRNYRLPFFVALSLAGIAIALGWVAGAWLVGIGAVLLGICHLPVPFRARVTLLLVVFAGLAVLRSEWVLAPWPRAVWPILGSMFAFRLIIYLYDMRHGSGPSSPWQALGYFFLLPNVCFALFPVVDFKTFCRTYYDRDPYWTSQVGVRWMTRGIVHLLLYRALYRYCALAPADVSTALDLLQFLVTSFALYLRVSGTFHLVIGILHLFGFNLPETHHQYFLASSINDFWRRINIYWKDFMLKIFFYPAFFRLRRHGTRRALVTATFFVAVVTWLLHSCQWFWIEGSFPLRWQDAVFWMTLGALMAANTLWEHSHPKRKVQSANRWEPGAALGRSLRVAATFSVICVLWSLWTSDSLQEWLSVWSILGESHPTTAQAGSAVPASLLALPLAAILLQGFGGRSDRSGKQGMNLPVGGPTGFWVVAAATSAVLTLLCVVGLSATSRHLGERTSRLINSLRSAGLNRIDAIKLQRGYYEDLLNVDRINSQLWEIYQNRPRAWGPIRDTPAARPTGDFMQFELVPFAQIIYKGAPFRVNSWGMRDREYTRAKPPHTYRIAMLGTSHVMGQGVADNETFENLLEDRLNRVDGAKSGRRYEILNFGMASHSPLHRLLTFETKALAFNPDAVFYVAHQGEGPSTVHHITGALEEGIYPPYPHLRELLREGGIGEGTPSPIAERRLRPLAPKIVTWAYKRLARECREREILPVWIYLPLLRDYENAPQELPPWLRARAENAGFVVIDLSGVYSGQDLDKLQVTEWDEHPNAIGHRLIADRLYAELSKLDVIPLAATKGTPQHTENVRPTVKEDN